MSFLGNVFTGIGKFANTLISPAASVIGTLETNKSQERIANQNIAYQKEMNNIQMEREDNAVERRALDLQRAGLSKTLAAGSPASATPLTAPKNEYVPESIAKALSKLNFLDKINESRNIQAIADKNLAEVKKIDSETTKNNITNSNLEESISLENDKIKIQSEFIKKQSELISSQIQLSNIEGEYRAEKLNAEINSMLSNTDLTKSNIKLKAEEIATELSRRHNLDKNTEKLIGEIAIQQWNLFYGKYYGTPAGQQPGGTFGSAVSAVGSSYTLIDGKLRELYNWLFGGKKSEKKKK